MLDIADPGQLRDYLIRRNLVGRHADIRLAKLGGGVSCSTFRVVVPGRTDFVIKQALPRLNVASRWLSSPGRAHREALGILYLRDLLPGVPIPRLLFEDRENHVLAMESVPEPHDNWKQLLLGGRLSEDHATRFGTMLAAIHAGALRRAATLEPVFRDRSFFETLRMEAYYQYTARHVPSAGEFIAELLAETRQQCVTLVHGDYSPKNVLIRDGQLILLDHETLHWGDPMFDIGFSLTHFLAKSIHLPDRRDDFRRLAQAYWQAYRRHAGAEFQGDAIESRAVRHTLACLLARVHGRSPLEYLDEPARQRLAAGALRLMKELPANIPDLVAGFARE
jgi:aminoglycoside phosphotransferase (APT) family kinase protein